MLEIFYMVITLTIAAGSIFEQVKLVILRRHTQTVQLLTLEVLLVENEEISTAYGCYLTLANR